MKMQVSLRKVVLDSLIPFLLLSFIICLALGSVTIALDHTFFIILNAIGLPVEEIWTPTEQVIVLQIRFPRIVMAMIVGAMLSIAGVGSQNLFKNPIADPYIIGISSAAGFGAVLVLILGLSFFQEFTLPFLSFLFGLLSIWIAFYISQKKQNISIYSLLLSGIALSYTFSALISLILFLSLDQSHMILTILMGHLWGTNWEDVFICIIVCAVCTVFMYYYGFEMNILLFGDNSAQTMGVNVKRSKLVILFTMTLLTSTAVAFCGTIGFLGLVVPHIARIFFGSDNRKLIFISGILGAIILLWADLGARVLVSPSEIPVGVFTSLMGGPFFIYLVFKNRKNNPQ